MLVYDVTEQNDHVKKSVEIYEFPNVALFLTYPLLNVSVDKWQRYKLLSYQASNLQNI
jgi:hypothetical protein